jgi:hypothetical protein
MNKTAPMVHRKAAIIGAASHMAIQIATRNMALIRYTGILLLEKPPTLRRESR